MLQSGLSKEQLDYCADVIKGELSPEIDYDREKMKKGLNLYRQGSVSNAVMTDQQHIEARVQDVTPFQVVLDLDFFLLSTCNCSAEGICRHKLAVFFYTYAMVERVGNFFQEWNSSKKTVPQIKQKAAPVKVTDTKPSAGETVRDWYAFFKKHYHVFKNNKMHTSYAFNQMYLFQSIVTTFFKKTLKQNAPDKPFVKDLYFVHTALFTMQKLVEESENSKLSHSSKKTHVYPYLSELLDAIYNHARDANGTVLPLSVDPLLLETKDQLNELLFCGHEYQYDKVLAYFLVWSSLLNRDEWIDDARVTIKKKQETYIKTKDSFAVDCQFALAHFAFLQKDDVEALRLIRLIQGNVLDYCYYWIGELFKAKEWDRQRVWLDATLEFLKDYSLSYTDYYSKRSTVKQLLPFYERNAVHNEDQAYYIEALKSLLPYSYAEYNEELLEAEDYHTWIELQILVGFDVSELGRTVIKDIEKIDRAVLLPLYHKAVNDAISQKNRVAYKVAVRYLKKLRTHYRQLKQLERWNAFIEQLAQEHKRLRAFQEELERGKLLHD